MSRLIDADALTKALVRKEPFSDCARVVIAECMEEIRHAPSVDAIPTEWIRDQMCEYPGMESAMWSKLLRIWKREAKK